MQRPPFNHWQHIQQPHQLFQKLVQPLCHQQQPHIIRPLQPVKRISNRQLFVSFSENPIFARNFHDISFFFSKVSYANAASPLNYATAQKLYAVPSYTQAYRSVVAPTAATTASPYTSAYIQPTGSSPVKVKFALNLWAIIQFFQFFIFPKK